MRTIILFGILLAVAAAPAMAQNGRGECSHPVFVEIGCESREPGPTGPAGPAGPRGHAGPSGADGAPGLAGLAGADGKTGPAGPAGADGVDGLDGKDGARGPAGVQGPVGPQGPAGQNGSVPEAWVNNLDNFKSDAAEYLAAAEAIQIYLPQEKKVRLTFSSARTNGNQGYGIGFATRADNEARTAFTFGIGTSHGKTVGKASIGMEF